MSHGCIQRGFPIRLIAFLQSGVSQASAITTSPGGSEILKAQTLGLPPRVSESVDGKEPRICTPGELQGDSDVMAARAHTQKYGSRALHSPSFFLAQWDQESYFCTASGQAFPNSVATHGETSIITGQQGQKLLSLPQQVLSAPQLPEAVQALTGNPDFT